MNTLPPPSLVTGCLSVNGPGRCFRVRNPNNGNMPLSANTATNEVFMPGTAHVTNLVAGNITGGTEGNNFTMGIVEAFEANPLFISEGDVLGVNNILTITTGSGGENVILLGLNAGAALTDYTEQPSIFIGESGGECNWFFQRCYWSQNNEKCNYRY